MSRKLRWCPRCKDWVDWSPSVAYGGHRDPKCCIICNAHTTPRPRKRPSRVRQTRNGQLVKDCDDLFSLIVRTRDGRCQESAWIRNRDGELVPHTCIGRLECAHMVSRRYKATRWSLNNAVALCEEAHGYYTGKPVEWGEWCEKRLGRGRWADLKEEAMRGAYNMDLDEVLAMLKVEAEKLGIPLTKAEQ